ncbi:glycosyltransferase [Luteimonas aquatica]|uniref:glycosyltransferase n=1 Tax=Luteimonas aquatica TaxID=450364 RepID=UPI001F599F57|nr:glycosyltransferase [Luteimonas aquatica]
MNISVVLLTYNWPEALGLALDALARQALRPLEVIVADDGSAEPTRALVAARAKDYPVPLRHIWHEDRGFRAGAARNRGMAASRGDYIVLVDGDMVAHPLFLADHAEFVEPGCFLAGGRLRASARETARLLAGGAARFNPLMDGIFDAPFDFHRQHALRWPALARHKARRPGRVMSCNMSFWREDALRVNGFDERMEGYGSEDLELAARLRNAGVRQKQLKFTALAVHLEHTSRAPADPDDPDMPNNRLLRETRQQKITRCERGMDQYLGEFG